MAALFHVIVSARVVVIGASAAHTSRALRYSGFTGWRKV